MADIEMAIDSIRFFQTVNQHVVILHERQTDRYLPIWIGPEQADSISMRLKNEYIARPMTHDFTCTIITALGGRIKSAVINKIENNTIYAKLIIKTFWKKMEIDCQPSDAIAIAVRQNVPIFANDGVLKIAGIILNAETGKVLNPENIKHSDVKQKQIDNLQNFQILLRIFLTLLKR